MLGLHRLAKSAWSGTELLPPEWTVEFSYIAEIFMAARKAYVDAGGGLTSLAEIGFDFEAHEKGVEQR